MNSNSFFALALATFALTCAGPLNAAPTSSCGSIIPLFGTTEPVLGATASTFGATASENTCLLANNAKQTAEVVVDFSSFYRQKFNDNRTAYINANPLEQQHGAETARAWTDDQMPQSLRYSRDGGAWSADIERDGNSYRIPDQPCGKHKYLFRVTFASGRGLYCIYKTFTPTLKPDEEARLDVDKQSIHNWTDSKKITFKLGDKLKETNPSFLTGTAKAQIEDDVYTVNKNGMFTATIPFAPAQNLLVKYSDGKCNLNTTILDFEASPTSPNFIVFTNENVCD